MDSLEIHRLIRKRDDLTNKSTLYKKMAKDLDWAIGVRLMPFPVGTIMRYDHKVYNSARIMIRRARVTGARQGVGGGWVTEIPNMKVELHGTTIRKDGSDGASIILRHWDKWESEEAE